MFDDGSTFLHVRVDTDINTVGWDGDPEKHPLRLLRKMLGWSQDNLAAASGVADNGKPRLIRLDINAIEKGKNKGSSAKVESGLAQALGLDRDTVRALLDFKLEPAEALARSSAQVIVHVRPEDGTDRYPERLRAIRFLRAHKVDESVIQRLYTEPDLQSGHMHRDHRFWMGLGLTWQSETPEAKAQKAAAKANTIRENAPAYREKLRQKEHVAPASERAGKRKRAVNE